MALWRNMAVTLVMAWGAVSCASPVQQASDQKTDKSKTGDSTNTKGDQGSKKDDEKSTPGDEDPTPDIPTWVNGSYLTCSWQGVESELDASVVCAVKSPQATQAPADISYTWRINDAGGQQVNTGQQSSEGNRFIAAMPARDFSGKSLRVELQYLAISKRLEAKFDELLQGLSSGGGLQACLTSGASVRECFTQHAIILTDDPPPRDEGSAGGQTPIPAPDSTYRVSISSSSQGGATNYSAAVSAASEAMALVEKVEYSINPSFGTPTVVVVTSPGEGFTTPTYDVTGKGLVTISAVVYFKDKRTPITLPDSRTNFL